MHLGCTVTSGEKAFWDVSNLGLSATLSRVVEMSHTDHVVSTSRWDVSNVHWERFRVLNLV